MSGEHQMRCPECGEDAVHQRPSDLVPWEAHGIATPEWSHKDGSSLCPVIGPSGYHPAQPEPKPGLDAKASGLEPPAGQHPPVHAEVARRLAERNDAGPAAGTAGVIGRQYMARAIARLGELHRQAAARPEPEPEAGG